MIQKESWLGSRSCFQQRPHHHTVSFTNAPHFVSKKSSPASSASLFLPLLWGLNELLVQFPVFLGCSCAWGRSELTALGPITAVPPPGTRGTPCGVAIPAVPTGLRWIPAAGYPSGEPGDPFPAAQPVPNLPGGSAHTTPFCSLGRGSGALKACPERAGTRGRRGPHPPAAPSRRSPAPTGGSCWLGAL